MEVWTSFIFPSYYANSIHKQVDGIINPPSLLHDEEPGG